jgi:hypothetical protein
MNEKLLKKLKKLLTKAGVEDEKIDDIVSQLDEKDTEEPVVEKEGETTEVVEPPIDDAIDEPVDGLNHSNNDNLPPVEEDNAQNKEIVEDETAVDNAPVDENPVPPVNDEVVEQVEPSQPEFDAESKLAEANNVIEGLKSRIDALEDALRKAGILEDEKVDEVGVDQTYLPSNDVEDNSFNSVLNDLNGRNRR